MNRSQFRRDLVALLREHNLYVGTVTFKENPVKMSLDVAIAASSVLDDQTGADYSGQMELGEQAR